MDDEDVQYSTENGKEYHASLQRDEEIRGDFGRHRSEHQGIFLYGRRLSHTYRGGRSHRRDPGFKSEPFRKS